SNLYENVQNNNNIVWKNITVVDEQPGGGRLSAVIIANFSDEIVKSTLVFRVPDKDRLSIFDWGDVFIELTPELAKLVAQHEMGDNVGLKPFDDTTFHVMKKGARLGPIELAPGAVHGLRMRFVPRPRAVLGARVLELDVVQKNGGVVVGGQRFVVKTSAKPRICGAGAVTGGLGFAVAPGGTPGSPAAAPKPCGCHGMHG